MNRPMLGLVVALLLGCGVGQAANVKLDLPSGAYSARFEYQSERGVDSASSPIAAKSGDSLGIPSDAQANIVLTVTDDPAGNEARVELGLPPKDDLDLKLTAEDFSWVETLEVRVTGQPDLQPVSGALVLVRREGKPETAWVGETTADGVARVGPVPSGGLSVDVYAPDRAPASQFFTIERERPAKVASIDVPLATPGALPPGEGAVTPAGAQPAVPATPSAAPLPMKVLVGLLGLVSLAFFARLWGTAQAHEQADASPLAPSRADRPFGGIVIGPAIVVALMGGIAAAISAGSAEGATPFLLCMLAQAGFALVTLTGIRGRHDALTGFGAAALTASFLAPLALAQIWIPGSDGTRLLALILDVVGATMGLAVLVAAVAALDRGQALPARAQAPTEATEAERALCPYCGEPISAATGACACETVAPAAAPAATSGEPVLMGVRGKHAGVEFAIRDDAPMRIGRDPASDIVVDDPTVSRRHAQVEREAESIVLTDLGSSNGTFLNGARVDRAALSPGDEIAIGGSAFRLQVIG